MNYPIWDIAMGGGVLMAVVAIAHVVVAHFAVGGGLVVAVTETLAVRRGDGELRELARRSSLILVLLSTVFGAVSGVGIWVTAGLIAPAAISALIHTYVWGWAIEWVFFIVEITTAVIYYATWDRISKGAHLLLIWVYFVSAYLSLVVINGIITFMLTPGAWLQTQGFWDGFFNPTYWPSLVLRTGIAVLMGTAFMMLAALRATPQQRARLVRYLGLWMTAGVLVAYGGYRWWEARLPASVTDLFRGTSPTLPQLATVRHLLLWALAATLVVVVAMMLALPRLRVVRGVAAVVLLASSVVFFGGYEWLREGVRKPFLIYHYMFSNGLRVNDIGAFDRDGFLVHDAWAVQGIAPDSVARGRAMFRAQCSSCHTIDGYQSIRASLPNDPDMISGVLMVLHDMGQTYAKAPPGQPVNVATQDYPYMPPLVGSEDEISDLAAYLGALAGVGGPTAAQGGRP